MLIKLKARSSAYGIALKPTEDIFKVETKGGLALPRINVFQPVDFVPTEGKVEYSCIPEVKKGDTVHMEYFGVIINLGKWWNPAAESDERNFILYQNKKGEKICNVLIRPKYLYYIEDKKGKITMLNGFNIIEPVMIKQSFILDVPLYKTNMARVTHGKYAGKTIVFHKHSDMAQLAHKRAVVNDQYVEALVENERIIPVGYRILVKPDRSKAFDEKGLGIPLSKRVVPNEGEVLEVGINEGPDELLIKIGDRVKYNPKGFTLVATKEHGALLLFNAKDILLIQNDMAKINPTLDRVLIEPTPPDTISPGGIHIPEKAQQKPQSGTVIAVGPGRDGKPMFIKPGDKVLYGLYSGSEIEIDKKKHLIMSQDDVTAVIND